jgi:hypothetical protein
MDLKSEQFHITKIRLHADNKRVFASELIALKPSARDKPKLSVPWPGNRIMTDGSTERSPIQF